MDTKSISYVGVDFGSFKTCVACSNGRREVLPTAVGWPKDHFARRTIGRDVVFGEELKQFRMALNIVRPFERGGLKFLDLNEAGVDAGSISRSAEAAKLLLDHVVSQVCPDDGSSVYGVIGAPARASIKNKQVLLDAARDAFDAVVIVSEPFALANGVNQFLDSLVVDIGAGTIDLCPLFGGYPADEDQITLPIGGDVVDAEFIRRLKSVHPDAQISANTAREIKEKYGSVQRVHEKAVVTLAGNGGPKSYDVTLPLHEACQTLVEPIVRGIKELVAKFDLEYQSRLLNHIVLGGGGSQLHGLDQLIEEGLRGAGGARVTRVQDPVFAGAVGALQLAMSWPTSYWQTMQQVDRLQRAA